MNRKNTLPKYRSYNIKIVNTWFEAFKKDYPYVISTTPSAMGIIRPETIKAINFAYLPDNTSSIFIQR